MASFVKGNNPTDSSLSIAKAFDCDIIPAESIIPHDGPWGGGQVKCPRCRCDNPAGTKFCSECGARLDKACPQCSHPIPADSKFCLSIDLGSR